MSRRAVHQDAYYKKITPQIKRALTFFIEAIPLLRPRSFNVRVETLPPVLMWTDASFESGVGKGGLVALVRDGKCRALRWCSLYAWPCRPAPGPGFPRRAFRHQPGLDPRTYST